MVDERPVTRLAALALITLLAAFAPAGIGGGGTLSDPQAATAGGQKKKTPAAAPALTVTHQARALGPGEAVLLTIEAPEALVAVDGRAFGRPLAAFPGDAPGRWQALVGIDVETAAGSYLVTIDARTAGGALMSGTHRLVVAARTFGVRRLTVAPEFLTPPASALARIEREQKTLGSLLAQATARPFWHGPFVRPVDGEPVSNFGLQSIFNGRPPTRHRGADFAGRSGDAVRAPNAGRVVLADDLYFSGNTVVLDHGCGLFSLLAHLSRIDVKVGDEVASGVAVGAVGATGRVTGPHLHWTVRIGAAAVDPLSLMDVTGR